MKLRMTKSDWVKYRLIKASIQSIGLAEVVVPYPAMFWPVLEAHDKLVARRNEMRDKARVVPKALCLRPHPVYGGQQ